MQKNGFCWTPLLSQAEPWSLCSILSPPSPHLQNKEAEREEASLQVELHTTDAPGSSQLMRGPSLLRRATLLLHTTVAEKNVTPLEQKNT